LLFVIFLTGVSQISVAATTIFSDNFDNENLDPNYTNFANWTVSDGAVDLIGQGSIFDLIPGNGRYVDLDGTAGDAGKMTSSVFSLTGGQNYILSFGLAGSQRGDTNTVTYGIDIDSNGTLDFIGSQTLASSDPLTAFNLLIKSSISTNNASIVFDHEGSDNIGLLLDNVALKTVPVPAALWLFGSALIGLRATRRLAA
jgi:Protein of unknown function (DUF642)